MNELKLDRIRKRSAINPELMNRQDIAALADGLNKIILGKEAIQHIGRWTLNNMGSPHVATLIYGEWNAAFGFGIDDNGSEILFENDHREAIKGWGITAFSELEHAAAKLATINNKPVTFIFPLFNQKDTEQFLFQRGYEKTDFSGILTFGSLAMKRTFQPIK